MNRFFVLLVIALKASHSYSQDIPKRLDSLMGYYVNEYNFNGVVLVANKGNVIFERAYGYRDLGKEEKHDMNSIFQVGTMTDQFTAEVVILLAQEHKLSLEDKLNKYFPKYPKGDSVTIRNLLTNTSGILDYMMFDGFLIKHDSLHVAKDSMMALFDKHPPQGMAGTRFQFSNSNYLMLGYIIEQVTHKDYAEVFRERIFKPLKMTSTGFDYRGLKDKHKCASYRHYGDQKKMVVMDSTLTGAGGALYSTAHDLYLWHKGLQSYKLLSKKVQDSMYVPFQRNYGYGWFSDTIGTKIGVVHGGQLQGFSTFILRIPSDDMCVILMQNIYYPAFDNNSVVHSITDAVYNKDFQMPVLIPEFPLTDDALKAFEGEFQFGSGVLLAITAGHGTLHGHNVPLKGQPDHTSDFDLTPIGENKFKTKSLNAILEFVSDNTGSVQQLVLHEPTHNILARKKVNK